MGNIFVRRPIFAMVIAIMIVVLGLIAIRSMPIEQYPDITPPVVEVSAEYLGADALTIEQSVATPLEESVNGVSDMIYMQSTNSNNGSMSLQVSFAVGTDPDMNTIFTQNRVSSATPMLPQVVIKQGVTTEKTMSSFIQVLSLYSDGRYDENFLGNYAILHIKDRLARINGVGSVQVMGGGAYAMRIWVKPDRMDYLGVTVADIASAIEQQSEVIPGGQLGAEPNDGSAQFTYTVRMPAQYNTVEQFERIVLRAEPDGSLVYLKDVADVELGSQTYDVYSTYQQQPSSMIMINQSPGSNAVEVGKEVNAAMRELSQSFPEGMHYHTIVDSTRTILLGIHDIVVTLALALLLVVLVIYLFLQNIRATIVPIIAIPVSLVGAFMVFPLFGFSINVFSLLGLVLAIGLVVDDAIVVVEAVQVNIEKGMNGKDATIAAMKTVASPIIATTTVLMAVFLPVGLMPGAAGKLYGQFAITIAISVALSGVNALSLSPALCSILLRPQSGKKNQRIFRLVQPPFRPERRQLPENQQNHGSTQRPNADFHRDIRHSRAASAENGSHRIPAQRGSGLSDGGRTAAGSRLAEPDQGSDRPDQLHPAPERQRSIGDLRCRIQHSVGQPIAEQRPDFHPTERLEPTQDDGRADHDPAQRAALL